MCCLAILFYVSLGLDPGLVGLSLAYVIVLADLFQYCMRTSAEVESLVRNSSPSTKEYTYSVMISDGISGESYGLWSTEE